MLHDKSKHFRPLTLTRLQRMQTIIMIMIMLVLIVTSVIRVVIATLQQSRSV